MKNDRPTGQDKQAEVSLRAGWYNEREYIELCAVERNKSQIYSHLFTFFVTVIAAVFSIYAHNIEKNVVYMSLVPAFIVVWLAFVMFNLFYLKAVRRRLAELEEIMCNNVRVRDRSDDKQSIRCEIIWYSKIYKNFISKGISRPLYSVNIILLLIVIIASSILGFKGFGKIFGPNRADLAYIIYMLILGAILGVIIGWNAHLNISLNKEWPERKKSESSGDHGT